MLFCLSERKNQLPLAQNLNLSLHFSIQKRDPSQASTSFDHAASMMGSLKFNINDLITQLVAN
jgi:hypothetical protein